jgi:transcriptional antiterminator NusG
VQGVKGLKGLRGESIRALRLSFASLRLCVNKQVARSERSEWSTVDWISLTLRAGLNSTTVNKQWYVFYTKSRQEKKVRDLLMKHGYDVFLPMQKVMRQWSDRKKKVEVPLFNSYIFVHELEYRIPEVLKFPGLAWNIRYNGKPAVLRQEEFELINRFITTGFFLETTGVEPDTFQVGDRARIIDGPLAGTTGILTGEGKNQKFNILLEGIQQAIQVQLPARLLEKYQ